MSPKSIIIGNIINTHFVSYLFKLAISKNYNISSIWLAVPILYHTFSDKSSIFFVNYLLTFKIHYRLGGGTRGGEDTPLLN